MLPQPPGEDHPTRRLLVADDDPLVRRVIQEFFGPHGYLVDAAGDGAEALQRLDETTPDVIIADILMPNLDGWEFFEQVRQRPFTVRIPFVFLTSEKDLPQRIRGFHMGADDYIVKPFDVEELHVRIERILHRHAEIERAVLGEGTLLTGSVRHIPLSDLLQLLALNGTDGTVALRQGPETGSVVFVEGSIVHATCGGVSGVKALYRMLGWAGASFRVLPPTGEILTRSVDLPTTSVLMDGLVSLDEWNRWRGMLPDEQTILELASDAKERLGSRRLAPAEVDVLTRARQGMAVGDILENCALPDADLAEAMCALLGAGVLFARI